MNQWNCTAQIQAACGVPISIIPDLKCAAIRFCAGGEYGHCRLKLAGVAFAGLICCGSLLSARYGQLLNTEGIRQFQCLIRLPKMTKKSRRCMKAKLRLLRFSDSLEM